MQSSFSAPTISSSLLRPSGSTSSAESATFSKIFALGGSRVLRDPAPLAKLLALGGNRARAKRQASRRVADAKRLASDSPGTDMSSDKDAEGGVATRLQPFERGLPKNIPMNDIQAVLDKGETWQTTRIMDKDSAIARAALDVNAPASVIWHQLSDFSTTAEKLPNINVCDVYRRTTEGGTDADGVPLIEKVFVKYVCPVFAGMKMTYHMVYTYEPAKNSVTWTLDHEQKNDFVDIQGHWHMEPQSSDPPKVRCFYEIALVLPGWLPQGVKNRLAKNSLSQTTSWLKKESEAEAGFQERSQDSPRLKPLEIGRPSIEMNYEVEMELAKNDVWQSVQNIKNGIRGQAVMDVAAPVDVVWNQLADVPSRKCTRPLMQHCKVYKTSKKAFVGRAIEWLFVRCGSQIGGRTFTYHMKHARIPRTNSIAWKLDDKKVNDFDQAQGQWHVKPHPDSVSKSRVFYEVGLVLPDSISNQVKDKLFQASLGDTLAWLKRESELEARTKLKPFERGRPISIETKKALKVLAKEKVWRSLSFIDGGVTGNVIMDVRAPPAIVWGQLSDFGSYPKHVSFVKSCEIERRRLLRTRDQSIGNNVEQILVNFVLSFSKRNLTCHTMHTYEPEKGSMTWSLDNSKENYLAQLEGHWHVMPHPSNPLESRVYFQIGVIGHSWLPQRVVEDVSLGAIKNATYWLQRESERATSVAPAALLPVRKQR